MTLIPPPTSLNGTQTSFKMAEFLRFELLARSHDKVTDSDMNTHPLLGKAKATGKLETMETTLHTSIFLIKMKSEKRRNIQNKE